MLFSLPVVSTLQDCALWTKTIEPFWPQLYSLPKQLIAVRSVDDLQNVYLSNNPFMTAFVFALVIGVITLVAAEINRNYSQVDRLWSILPTIYNAHYCYWAHLEGLPTLKLDLVLLVSTLWSIRLSYNYWRKGGYNIGVEDYRWPILRKQMGPYLFTILNWTFISFGQSILLMLITAPTYILLCTSRITSPSTSLQLDTYDLIFPATWAFLLAIETLSDQQQWRYHKAKHAYEKTAKIPSEYKNSFSSEDLDRGFLTSGLFAYARHPNYAAEMGVWLTLYVWGCYTSQTRWNWTVGAALAYVFIFLSSTPLTEGISTGKYDEYTIYQSGVGRFVPDVIKVARGGFKGAQERASGKKTK
ncbi:DUF1295-domain-containing protein [Rhizodiscina lignyota]|uniref:DUF1295-domain-containing protein n=1 Tax=Rhizodiscina lignyota TaxID=1504668 RepID=A0A9P4IHZ3_9PEZI|nr:DUF1295-domain-containing protein [Rhizodiscina lignyota]